MVHGLSRHQADGVTTGLDIICQSHTLGFQASNGAGGLVFRMESKELVGDGESCAVITQLDWCPVGNLLESATVKLNRTVATQPEKAVVVAFPSILHASHGDVHIVTPDSLTFDFQATGDLFLFRSRLMAAS